MFGPDKILYFTNDIAFAIVDPLTGTVLDGSDTAAALTDDRVESSVICTGCEVYQLFNVRIDVPSYQEYGFGADEIQIIATDMRSGAVLYRSYLNPNFSTQMRTIGTIAAMDNGNDDYDNDDCDDCDFEIDDCSGPYCHDEYQQGSDWDEGVSDAMVYTGTAVDNEDNGVAYFEGCIVDNDSFHLMPHCRQNTGARGFSYNSLGMDDREEARLRLRLSREREKAAWVRYEMDEPLVLDFLQSPDGSMHLRRIAYTFAQPPNLDCAPLAAPPLSDEQTLEQRLKNIVARIPHLPLPLPHEDGALESSKTARDDDYREEGKIHPRKQSAWPTPAPLPEDSCSRLEEKLLRIVPPAPSTLVHSTSRCGGAVSAIAERLQCLEMK